LTSDASMSCGRTRESSAVQGLLVQGPLWADAELVP